MAIFLIKSIDGDHPMFSCSRKERAIQQAERFRQSKTPCYIMQFSKAGHPRVARIEYYDNMDAWIETQSEPLK